jgi:hypothetical protein
MNRILLYRVVISLFFSCLLLLHWSCRESNSSSVALANYLIQQNFTTAKDSSQVEVALRTLLPGTHYERHFQVNRTYDAKQVNTYIIDSREIHVAAAGQLSECLNNCAYIGDNIIVLDAAYIDSFLDRHHVIKDSFDIAGTQQCFLLWILGHELGHLLCGHLDNHHFEGRSLEGFVKNASIENKEELKADSVFVSIILKTASLLTREESTMISILNAEIKQKTGEIPTAGVGLLYDYTNQHIVQYAQQPTHPEFVIRLSRMLELGSAASGNQGLHNLISRFISQLKEQAVKH